MPRGIRRIIFALFVLVFSISASVLIFTASGYRYHSAKRVIEKTGTLIIVTQPRGARVLLNGLAPSAATTPLSLTSLLSGEYQLTVEREGFFPFSRWVTVTPGVSTIVHDIALVRRATPRLAALISEPRGGSVRGGSLVIRSPQDVIAYELRTERIRQLAHTKTEIAGAQFSASSALMVFETRSGWSIHDATKGELLSQKQSEKKITNIQFAERSDDLYALSIDGLYRFEKDRRRFLRVLAYSAPTSFAVVGDSAFVTRYGAGLTEFRLSNGARIRTIDDLPFLQTIVQVHDRIVVLGGAGQSLYLFDRTARVAAFQQVTNASALAFAGSDRFFSYNEFEVWKHDLSADRYTRDLVTRQSASIQQIVPFTTRSFIVVISKNGTIALRFLEPGADTEIALAKFDSVAGAFLDQKEKTLLILGSFNGVDGLYTVPLIEEESVFPLVK